MKEERIFQAIGEADVALLERCQEDMQGRFRKAKHRWLLAGVAACLALAVGVTAAVSVLSRQNRWPLKVVEGGTSSTTSEVEEILPWDDLTVDQQFSILTFAGREYGRTGGGDHQPGELLGAATLTGYDVYTETTYTHQGEVYRLPGISEECAVLVHFAEQPEAYYPYACSDYQPETLGQFLDDLNLQENLVFGTMYYEYEKDNGQQATVEFTGGDREILWELLFSETDLPLAEGYYESPELMEDMPVLDIAVDIPVLGIYNISVAVTEEGYLTTNILATGKAFFIGTDRVQAVVDYVTENCTGYELVYESQLEENPVPEGGGEAAVDHSVGAEGDVSSMAPAD